MSAATAPRSDRRVALTDKGLTAVSLFRLRECWDDLSPCERRQLTAQLVALTYRFAPRRPGPAA